MYLTMESARIQTAIRVRSHVSNRNSLSDHTASNQCIAFVSDDGRNLRLVSPFGDDRSFTFDYTLWSVDRTHPLFSNQLHVFDRIGAPVVNASLEGVNCAIFAYGVFHV